MDFRHANKILRKMDEQPDFDGGFSGGLAKAFRLRMQAIRAAVNENDLRARKSYRFEKLKGDRSSDYSIRLNDQFRLTFQIEKKRVATALSFWISKTTTSRGSHNGEASSQL